MSGQEDEGTQARQAYCAWLVVSDLCLFGRFEKCELYLVDSSPYSSVVEHPLSKRKVGSSILPGGNFLAAVSCLRTQCLSRDCSVLHSRCDCIFKLLFSHVYNAFVSDQDMMLAMIVLFG